MKMKKGISLIVLSITILVMAILAATAIISLEDSGIIGRSKNTVTNQQKQEEYTRLQVIKNGILTDNLGTITVAEYIEELKNKGLIENDVSTTDNGNKKVKTKSGIDVYINQDGASNLTISFEDNLKISTLGELITGPEDYGKLVDYTVTTTIRMEYWDGEHNDEQVTLSKWRIYYHNKDYVYLVSAESAGIGNIYSAAGNKFGVEKFFLGAGRDYEGWGLTNFGNLANTADYGTNVVGVVGGPTVELFVAGWNAKGYSPKLKAEDLYGIIEMAENYNSYDPVDLPKDGLYITGNDSFMVAPLFVADTLNLEPNRINIYNGDFETDIYPLICLKTSTPATMSGGEYDFHLIKAN